MHDGGIAPTRSRRKLLAGGAAAALGVTGFETLARPTRARAQTSLPGGEFSSGYAPAAVALGQSGGSVAVDASKGNDFTLSLTASGWTIASPANAVGDGQVIHIQLSQDAAGGRTVSWGGGYNWGSTGGAANNPPALSTAGGGTDILTFEYVAALSQWCFLGAAFPQGYSNGVKAVPISVVQSIYVPFNVQGNFTNNVTPGNSIVLFPALYSVEPGTFSTSNPQFGSRGNSVPGIELLQGAGPFPPGAQGFGYTAAWLLPNVAGNATLFRIEVTTPPSGSLHAIVAYEVAGLGTAPQLDPAGGLALGTGYSARVDSGVCPPITQPAEIIFGFGHIYNPDLPAPSPEWTAMTGGPLPDFWTGYQISDVPGNTYEWLQIADGTASWGSAVAAICPQPV